METFNFIENGKWGQYLLVDSGKLDETIKYIKEKKIKNVELNYYRGYKLKNIDFLNELADIIEGLNVIDSDVDLKGLENLKKLKMLNISDEQDYPIDFSNFRELEKCSVLWHKNLTGLSSCVNLSELLIKKVKITKDSAEIMFEGLNRMKILTFIQSKFDNLEYLKYFPRLEELNIYYSSSLTDISGLRYIKDSLKKLLLEHCKNINNYNVISHLYNIQYLGLNNLKSILTLSFIAGLRKLKHLSFVETNVLDGDLSYCVGIQYVGFNYKKHYSHRPEQIQNL
jgi:hypothetical protein